MRVMVAGGAGFIGSALVRNLLAHDHDVFVLDDFSGGSRANLAGMLDPARLVDCDAAAPNAVRAVLRRLQPSHVVSCIGDTFVPAAYHFPERFLRNNLDAHLNLLQACRQPGIVKLLYLSTAEVYGNQAIPLDEDAALGAANTYAVSKLAADRLMATFAGEHGVPTLIARMFNCYGPRETHAYIVPELIDQFSRSAEVTIGETSAIRDLTYVEDTAEALRRLLFADTPGGLAVNVGSGDGIDVAGLAARIGRLMGHATPVVRTEPSRLRRNEIDVIRCDNARLRALTGWEPTVSLDEGLARTIAWFRANGNAWPWQTHDEESAGRPAVARQQSA